MKTTHSKIVASVLLVILLPLAGASTGTVIDSAEDSDISEYVGDTGNFTTTTNKSFDGSVSIYTQSQDRIMSTSGLDNYLARGQNGTVRTYIETNDRTSVFFGLKNTSNTFGYGYNFVIKPGSDTLRLDRNEGGSTTTLATANPTSRDINSGEWYKIRIEYGSDGTIKITLYDEAGGFVDSVSATDSTYDGSGIGFRHTVGGGDGGQGVWWDAFFERDPPSYSISNTSVDTKEADGIQVTDLDGDGDLDMVSAEGTTGANWWENDGSGGFSAEKDVMTNVFSNSVEGVNAEDFDGDNKYSVIALSNDGGKMEIVEATAEDASSWSSNTTLISSRAGIQKTTIFDIDGDGDHDIAYSWEGDVSGDGGYHWLENQGGDPTNASNWKDHTMATVEGAWWITNTIDIDGDGDKDLVGTVRNQLNSNGDTRVLWVEQPSDSTTTWNTHTIDNPGSDEQDMADLGDMDGDGDLDVISGTHGTGTGLFWYENGNSWSKHTIESTKDWYSFAPADYDGDDRDELVAIEATGGPGGTEDDAIIYYDYDGSEWRATTSILYNKTDSRLPVVDLDGEDDYDIAVGSQNVGTEWIELDGLSHGPSASTTSSNSDTYQQTFDVTDHTNQGLDTTDAHLSSWYVKQVVEGGGEFPLVNPKWVTEDESYLNHNSRATHTLENGTTYKLVLNNWHLDSHYEEIGWVADRDHGVYNITIGSTPITEKMNETELPTGVDPNGDLDGDGLLNAFEGGGDLDGDGVLNFEDGDADGDGVLDGTDSDYQDQLNEIMGPTAVGTCTLADGSTGVSVEYWDPSYSTSSFDYTVQGPDGEVYEGQKSFDREIGYWRGCVGSKFLDGTLPGEANVSWNATRGGQEIGGTEEVPALTDVVGGPIGNAPDSPAGQAAVFGGLGAALVGLYVGGRRVGPNTTSVPRVGEVGVPPAFAVGAPLVGLVALDLAGGGVISFATATVVDNVGPIAGIAGIGGVGYLFYKRYIGSGGGIF